jgi:opacity protein-like surface antigen
MTVKKLALLGVASMAALGMSISMAGGPATCAPAADVSGVYVGVNVGGNYDNSLKFSTAGLSSTAPFQFHSALISAVSGASYKAAPWGWTLDAAIGYQFNNNWALQFGYIWNQEQKMNATVTAQVGALAPATEASTLKLQTYSLYLALRGMLPLWDDFSAYMMVGPAWTHLKASATFAATTGANFSETDSYWSPMAAVGVSWNVADSMAVNLQYMYTMADFATKSTNTMKGFHKGTQRVTVGLGYLFAM